MVISRDTVTIDDNLRNFIDLRHSGDPNICQRLRNTCRHIYAEARGKGIQCDVEQVWIDLPMGPKAGKDIRDAYVLCPGNILRPLSDIFPIYQWLDQF